MKTFRKKFAKYPLVTFFCSIKITVICLCALFILTLWGTIDQVSNGLYHAQETFFNSYFFTAFGFLPLPGAQLVMWVLFLNLVTVALFRFNYNRNNVGILIIHLGLLSYFIAAFVTLHCVVESQITLHEKEGTNVSQMYHDWELSVWNIEGKQKKVVAFETNSLISGDVLDYSEYGLTALVKTYYKNTNAFLNSKDTLEKTFRNGSGIQSLRMKSREKEPEKNIPGGTFEFKATDEGDIVVILYGGETRLTPILKNNKVYYVQLRRKRHALPLFIQLLDFRVEKHPNTEVARSYESLVEIDANNIKREVLISMNKPLIYKNYAFYQASYSIDKNGKEASTLAVVRNSGRLLPYIASLLTFLGLAIHFLFGRSFMKKKKVKK